MTTIKCNVRQRIGLTLLLGEQRGTVAEISLWMRIIEKVRLSEQDSLGLSLKQEGNAIGWNNAVENDFATRVDIEEQDKEKLLGLLKTFPNFGLNDIAWVSQLIDQLEAKAATQAPTPMKQRKAS